MNYNFVLYTIHMWLKDFWNSYILKISIYIFCLCNVTIFSYHPNIFLPLYSLCLIPIKDKVDIYVHYSEILGKFYFSMLFFGSGLSVLWRNLLCVPKLALNLRTTIFEVEFTHNIWIPKHRRKLCFSQAPSI
jgi:hypothetical protein